MMAGRRSWIGRHLTQRVERGVSCALAIVAVAGLAGFLRSWPPSGEPAEVALKGFLSLAVLAALAATRLAPIRRLRRASLHIHAACATAAVVAHYNFGAFHFPHFTHYWEQFHYELGARYFPELGYDGLYAASVLAEREVHPERPEPRNARDLRTNRVRRWFRMQDHAREVRARFTPQRWREFVADHAHFVRVVHPDDLAAMRRDHGYNPSPTWTAVARTVQGDGRLDAAMLVRLGAIDSVLIGIAFVALFPTFGARIGCLGLVLFGLGYAARYKWIGGAYLRFDWVAALVVAVCALRRGRAATAGALLGYATAVRIFPVAFLCGPAVAAVAAYARGERPRWPLRLFAGFGAALAVAVVVGGFAGRGIGAWGEFAERLQLYQISTARNAVGLEWLVLYGGETLERAALEMGGVWQLQREDVAIRKQDRRVALVFAQALLLLLFVASVWRAPPDVAAAASMVALFTLTASACYYWALLLLAPVAWGFPAVAGLLALSGLMYFLDPVQTDNLVRYGLFSWGLALLFVATLWPEASRTLPGLGRRSSSSSASEGYPKPSTPGPVRAPVRYS
jgi:hypothetical protein